MIDILFSYACKMLRISEVSSQKVKTLPYTIYLLNYQTSFRFDMENILWRETIIGRDSSYLAGLLHYMEFDFFYSTQYNDTSLLYPFSSAFPI